MVPPLLIAGLTQIAWGLVQKAFNISGDGDPTTSLPSFSLSSLIITLSVQMSETYVRPHFMYNIQLVGEHQFSQHICVPFLILLVNSSMMWQLAQDEILNLDQQAVGGTTELSQREFCLWNFM